ncbi:transferrin-binding protein-like solute binding protein [Haemophilus parainfluenzae]|uniref:transferrin-binding protein-like solute binding protein n=1 Tax=Haemophilus parainfluenzae TaxID=729 RepID=UPI000DAE64AF|nr:transferrin-binding protein-like solute binding protein [Haemophilus parainfluenzae]RDE77042.1 ABC transporter substrate-binding protein [Haemophilus parainfluenzae]
MNKIKLSIIALSCVMALSACSSSSKGGSDNSEQIRQAETELNQRITEANKKAEAAVQKAEAAIKAAQNNSEQTEAEKKAAEERLKQLENLQADEKARIPLSDKIFGGISGNMEDAISGGVLIGKGNNINRPQARDIQHLAVIDNKSGKVRDVPIFKEANAIDPWSGEQLEDDPYNLRKEGETILSNSNFQASAFGTYIDDLIDQYFFAQGLPTAIAQIPTTGLVEYKGGAVYKKDGSNSERSEMKATADFANKVIDINITEKANAVPSMNFGGKITGNSFAGEVNGIKTQGGFFGENAQEMTGLFTNEADQSRGAFGGIKQ